MNNSSTTGEIIEDKFYSVGVETNALYITDLLSGKRKYIGKAVPDNEWSINYFLASTKSDNEIWFIPFSGNKILIFNIANNTKEYIDIPQFDGNDFIEAIEKDGFIWLIPFDYPNFVKVSISDKKITIIDSIIKSDDKYLKEKYYGAIDCGDYFIITPGATNSIFKLYINDKTVEEIIKFDNLNNNYVPNVIGENIYFSSTISNNPIYIYENGMCRPILVTWGKKLKFAFVMVVVENKLILFNEENCDAYYYDVNDESYGIIEYNNHHLRSLITNKKYKDIIYIFPNKNDKFFLKLSKERIECVPLEYEDCFDLKMLLYDLGVVNE